MKNLLTIILLLSFSVCSFSQSIIEVQKPGVYTQNGQRLKVNDLISLMQENPEALSIMTKAKANYNGGMALGFIGGFLIGWPIGTAIGGGKPNWVLAAIGVPITIIGFTLGSTYKKQSAQAVEIYNGAITARHRPSLRFGVNNYGLTITLRF